MKQNTLSAVDWLNSPHNHQECGVKQEFSIKDLENLTGVKAHTIRIWEQRYDLLHPERSETNIRTYSGDDLKTLLNVSLLVDRGMKISKVAELSSEEIIDKIQSGPTISEEGEELVAKQRLKVAMMSYDEKLFRETMDECIDRLGFESTVLRLCLPFLADVGVLWLTNAICPAQEHFMSNLLRQVLFAQIQQSPVPSRDAKEVVVLYLPEREIHDISLLFVHQLCRANGLTSIFLGQSVPFDDLSALVAEFDRVKFVTYCTTYPASGQAQDYIDRISRTFEANPNVMFHLAGSVFEGCQGSDNVTVDVTGGSLVQRLF